MYRQMGIATFEMQSFGSRGISSTVGTQVDVTTGMIVLDVYRAFEKLAKDPRIDKDRVGITGWSLGGAVTLFSGWLPLKEKINTQRLMLILKKTSHSLTHCSTQQAIIHLNN